MRVHFVLDDDADADLILWWAGLPKGRRSEELRRILRWYLVPGGFKDLLDRLGSESRLPARLAPEVQGALNRALADFGWDEE